MTEPLLKMKWDEMQRCWHAKPIAAPRSEPWTVLQSTVDYTWVIGERTHAPFMALCTDLEWALNRFTAYSLPPVKWYE